MDRVSVGESVVVDPDQQKRAAIIEVNAGIWVKFFNLCYHKLLLGRAVRHYLKPRSQKEIPRRPKLAGQKWRH